MEVRIAAIISMFYITPEKPLYFESSKYWGEVAKMELNNSKEWDLQDHILGKGEKIVVCI